MCVGNELFLKIPPAIMRLGCIKFSWSNKKNVYWEL